MVVYLFSTQTVCCLEKSFGPQLILPSVKARRLEVIILAPIILRQTWKIQQQASTRRCLADQLYMSERSYSHNKSLPCRPFCYSCIDMEQRFKGFISLVLRLQNDSAQYLEEYATDANRCAASEAQHAVSVLQEQKRVVKVLDRASSTSVATKNSPGLEGLLCDLARSVWRVRQIARSAPYNSYVITSYLEQTCQFLRSIWTRVSPRNDQEYRDRRIIFENLDLSGITWLPKMRIASDTDACEDCRRVDTSSQEPRYHLSHPSERATLSSEKQKTRHEDGHLKQTPCKVLTDSEPERAVPNNLSDSCDMLGMFPTFGPSDLTLPSFISNGSQETRLGVYLAKVHSDYASESSSCENISGLDSSFLPLPLYIRKTLYLNSKGSSTTEWMPEELEQEQEIPQLQNVQKQLYNVDTGVGHHRNSETVEWDYASTEKTVQYKSKTFTYNSNVRSLNREVYTLGHCIYEHGDVIESLEL